MDLYVLERALISMHSSRGDVVRRLHKLASKLSFADYMHTLIPLFGDYFGEANDVYGLRLHKQPTILDSSVIGMSGQYLGLLELGCYSALGSD